jgi:outer membrane protein TolC
MKSNSMKETKLVPPTSFDLFICCLVLFATSSGASAQTQTAANRLTRDEAVRLALAQASAFQQAKIAESIAAEDVRQARIAFLPKVTLPSTVIYNSPTLGPVSPGTPGADRFSFISANAVAEYESLIGASGEIDSSGRLRAALGRSVALLEAARAGTEIARRALVQGVDDAYYGLALSTAKRRSSELSVTAAEEFAHITDLMFNAGEVAQVDVTRARVQVASRRDDLEQSRVAESVAAGALRVLVGYDFATPVEVVDLSSALPDATEINRFVESAIATRPEFAQLDAERRAAEQEARAARAERLPQFTYSLNGGFDSQSLRPDLLHDHLGVLATVSVTIPIFDWGASRSRQRQARLRAQSFDNERVLAVRNLTRQFYSAQAQALAAASRYQILSASVTDAERNVTASLARYRGGEAQFIEVSDSLSTLAAQRAALYQALFDYQSARARLLQLTGQ